ncbi:MAG: hypothetical protein IT558_04370 [Alphaproteobacteria bacterium]|nr:hypothetical protein [Alphaproteobacteria bacterium]
MADKKKTEQKPDTRPQSLKNFQAIEATIVAMQALVQARDPEKIKEFIQKQDQTWVKTYEPKPENFETVLTRYKLSFHSALNDFAQSEEYKGNAAKKIPGYSDEHKQSMRTLLQNSARTITDLREKHCPQQTDSLLRTLAFDTGRLNLRLKALGDWDKVRDDYNDLAGRYRILNSFKGDLGFTDSQKESLSLIRDNLTQLGTSRHTLLTEEKIKAPFDSIAVALVKSMSDLSKKVNGQKVDASPGIEWKADFADGQEIEKIKRRMDALFKDRQAGILNPDQGAQYDRIFGYYTKLNNWRIGKSPNGPVTEADLQTEQFTTGRGNTSIADLRDRLVAFNNNARDSDKNTKEAILAQAKALFDLSTTVQKKIADKVIPNDQAWEAGDKTEMERINQAVKSLEANPPEHLKGAVAQLVQARNFLYNKSPLKTDAAYKVPAHAKFTAESVFKKIESTTNGAHRKWEQGEKDDFANLELEVANLNTASRNGLLNSSQQEALKSVSEIVQHLVTCRDGNGTPLDDTKIDELKTSVDEALAKTPETRAPAIETTSGSTTTAGGGTPTPAGGGATSTGGGATNTGSTPKPPLTEAEKAELERQRAITAEENAWRREFNKKVEADNALNRPTASQMFNGFVSGTKGTISGITNGLLDTFANTGSDSDKTIRSAVGVMGSALEGITSIFGTMATSKDPGAQGLVKMLGMGGGFALGAALIPKIIGMIPILGGILNFGGLSSLAGGALGALIAYYGVSKIQPPSEPALSATQSATGGAHLPVSTSGFLGDEPVERPAVVAPVSVPAVEKNAASPDPLAIPPEPAPRSPDGPLVFPSFEPEPEPVQEKKKEASLHYREGRGINFGILPLDIQGHGGGLPANGVLAPDNAVMSMVNTHALDRANGPIEVVGQDRGGNHVGVDMLFGISPTSVFYTPPARIETVKHGTGNQVAFNRAVKRTLQDLKNSFVPAQTMQPAFDLG